MTRKSVGAVVREAVRLQHAARRVSLQVLKRSWLVFLKVDRDAKIFRRKSRAKAA